MNNLDQPLELTTSASIVCADCCCEWLKVANTLSCPCCYGEHPHTFSTIRSGPTLVLKLAGGLQTECRECNQVVKVANYHADNCDTFTFRGAGDVLQRPVSVPLNPYGGNSSPASLGGPWQPAPKNSTFFKSGQVARYNIHVQI